MCDQYAKFLDEEWPVRHNSGYFVWPVRQFLGILKNLQYFCEQKLAALELVLQIWWHVPENQAVSLILKSVVPENTI